jgi:hypothetical protein
MQKVVLLWAILSLFLLHAQEDRLSPEVKQQMSQIAQVLEAASKDHQESHQYEKALEGYLLAIKRLLPLPSSPARPVCGLRPTGWNARSTTFSASGSTGTRT